MIFELAHHVQSFLSEHNKPPPKSFHEEMLERQAQEKQQRMLEARLKQEQEVRPDGWCWDSLQASVALFPLWLWPCLWVLLIIWFKKCAFMWEKSLQVTEKHHPVPPCSHRWLGALLQVAQMSGLSLSLSLPTCTGAHWIWRIFSFWLKDVANAQGVEEPGLKRIHGH